MSKKKSNAGRKSKLTPEAQEKICSALRAGNFRITSAQYAGVSFRAFNDWMNAGEAQTSGKFRDFRKAVIEAEKAAEIRAVALVMQAAQNDPRHAEWWLSHRWPERWGEKTRIRAQIHAAASAIDVTSLREQFLKQLRDGTEEAEIVEGDADKAG